MTYRIFLYSNLNEFLHQKIDLSLQSRQTDVIKIFNLQKMETKKKWYISFLPFLL